MNNQNRKYQVVIIVKKKVVYIKMKIKINFVLKNIQ